MKTDDAIDVIGKEITLDNDRIGIVALVKSEGCSVYCEGCTLMCYRSLTMKGWTNLIIMPKNLKPGMIIKIDNTFLIVRSGTVEDCSDCIFDKTYSCWHVQNSKANISIIQQYYMQ